MDLFLRILASAIAVVLYLGTIRNLIHMFQLNSYKHKVQIKWYSEHLSRLLPVSGAIPRKMKKKLVYTMRVKRLIATLLIIMLIAVGLDIFLPTDLYLSYVVLILAPFVVLLADYINRPLENMVKNHYINEAKQMLQSSPNLTIIGVTGSYGKTSVKYYLSTLLKAKYNVLMTPESFNTPMGVVRTVREQLKPTHNMFICEMGARNVGDIKELCDLVHPVSGVITSIGEQHLESFKTIQNIINTKFELEAALPDNGTIFLNGDNEYIRERELKEGRKAVTYGLTPGNDYFGTDIETGINGTTFTVKMPGGKSCTYKTKLIGSHNVLNIVGATAVSCTYGIEPQALIPYVRKLEPVPHRLQLIRNPQLTIIDDAYNANPNGAKAALETLGMMDGTRIIITPGMVELGDKAEELNSELGARAAKVCDYIFAVGTLNGESICKGAKNAGFVEERLFFVKTLDEALKGAYAIQTEKPKIVLLENDLTDNY